MLTLKVQGDNPDSISRLGEVALEAGARIMIGSDGAFETQLTIEHPNFWQLEAYRKVALAWGLKILVEPADDISPPGKEN